MDLHLFLFFLFVDFERCYNVKRNAVLVIVTGSINMIFVQTAFNTAVKR
jgi:hypothetical protein